MKVEEIKKGEYVFVVEDNGQKQINEELKIIDVEFSTLANSDRFLLVLVDSKGREYRRSPMKCRLS
jgi:hypothetical protein